MERDADVVVVGAGIVGCATAYFLARRGARVAVIERGPVPGEQSRKNWGFVRQQGRDPLELPLVVEANRLWQGLERELNADIEWVQGGNLALAADESRMARFEHVAAAGPRVRPADSPAPRPRPRCGSPRPGRRLGGRHAHARRRPRRSREDHRRVRAGRRRSRRHAAPGLRGPGGDHARRRRRGRRHRAGRDPRAGGRLRGRRLVIAPGAHARPRPAAALGARHRRPDDAGAAGDRVRGVGAGRGVPPASRRQLQHRRRRRPRPRRHARLAAPAALLPAELLEEPGRCSAFTSAGRCWPAWPLRCPARRRGAGRWCGTAAASRSPIR